MPLITILFKSMRVELKPKKWLYFVDFVSSFYASLYYILTERTSALMFQNYDKYVNKSSIFIQVALWG